MYMYMYIQLLCVCGGYDGIVYLEVDELCMQLYQNLARLARSLGAKVVMFMFCKPSFGLADFVEVYKINYKMS